MLFILFKIKCDYATIINLKFGIVKVIKQVTKLSHATIVKVSYIAHAKYDANYELRIIFL